MIFRVERQKSCPFAAFGVSETRVCSEQTGVAFDGINRNQHVVDCAVHLENLGFKLVVGLVDYTETSFDRGLIIRRVFVGPGDRRGNKTACQKNDTEYNEQLLHGTPHILIYSYHYNNNVSAGQQERYNLKILSEAELHDYRHKISAKWALSGHT